MGDHVVLTRKLLVADWARVILNVGLVRGHVVPAEVAYVGVGALAHGASVDVALLHAVVPDRALGAGALGLAVGRDRGRAGAGATTRRPLVGAFELGLANFGLTARDQIKYGTG